MNSPLVELYRTHSDYLEPLPTDEKPVLNPLPGIRAVVFDIYGTLIISGTGDISLAEKQDREAQLTEALEAADLMLPAVPGKRTDLLNQTIKEHQQARQAEGIEYPEVEIRDVWREFLQAEMAKGALEDEELTAELVEQIAVEYEVRVNPVWPMPHLEQTLQGLRERQLTLGIVSNAQFYTPLMFEAFLGKDLDALGFAPEARVYSYELREGKPSTRLYEVLARQIQPLGLRPAEVLYVGNDLRNDIWPAQLCGYQTALFAGDKRSLRWREDDARLQDVRPDLILTDLQQILEVL
ncbi:MAG: putative hydrolase of the HAD superfamily [Puniceicoccaceae bacterium 5H]|nr:MAG: putative hydrolase of the HAD superfamily [Puniceicoccaceae bacterium 5H]